MAGQGTVALEMLAAALVHRDLFKDQKTALILSGANIDPSRLLNFVRFQINNQFEAIFSE